MMRKVLLFFTFLCLSVGAAMAQTGKLAGKVVDASTKEVLPFANVVVKLDGTQRGYGQTDIDGNYSISPLNPGTYSVEVMFIGYSTQIMNGVVVSTDKTTNLNFELNSSTTLGTVDVVTYEVPIISKDETTTGGTLTKEQIQKLPTREVSTMAASTPGVFSSDDNRALNVKGTRSGATTYYVNGVKQIGPTPNIPVSAISQMSVLNGGIPAQYGDATGGIINITTSGPSSEFRGGISAETSTIFDKYDRNVFDVSLNGPLLKKQYTDTITGETREKALLGFFLAAQYEGAKDNNPHALGVYKVKDDIMERINNNPFIVDPNSGNLVLRAESLTFDSLERVKTRQNVETNNISLNGAIDFQPKDNMTFTLGGNYEYYNNNAYVDNYALLNSEYNPQRITNNYNAYARFTQNFRNIGADNSGIRNAYYSIQFDYSKVKQTTQPERYKDDIARYAYIGKFNQSERPVYENLDSLEVNGTTYYDVNNLLGYQSTGFTFDPSGDNPNAASYTTQILRDREERGLAPLVNPLQLISIRGMLNGFSNQNLVHSLYSASGSYYSSYQTINNDQYRLSALGSAEFGKHTIRLGFEFEQRIQTNYTASSTALWSAARSILNAHISDSLDMGSAQVTTSGDSTYVNYNYYADPNQETVFSQNFRNKLGIASNTIVNIDAISPDDLKISDFSGDEVINNGIASYQGYTYDGTRRTSSVAFNDFFTNLKERPQDAFRPVYAAAFIEDKFEIEDLVLRIGVRVDRYDANQQVLKDEYAMVDMARAGDVNIDAFANSNYSRPSNVQDDWVVYVDKDSRDFNGSNASQFNVVGYRSGDVFYDVNGTRTDDISQIQQGGNTYPLYNSTAQGLVIDPANPEGNQNAEYIRERNISLRAFTDYDPQITVMPRLSFSFPISEDALFFAHYDILTQRPEQNSVRPIDYYYLGSGNLDIINNPNLKPQKKIDYQVGFQQRLTVSSGLTISAFYSELRDMIQVRRIFGAYPIDYMTFSNLDFGIVKGMTLEYDLRRTKGFAMGASYTMQFATGTGSSATSGFNAVSQGQPNLRTPVPLDYDQRHAFKINFDYRFMDGEGPALFGVQAFQNTGINFLINAGSGTPYSRQQSETQAVSIGVQQRSTLEGSLNGSRLPANWRASLRIDKDFKLGSNSDNPFIKSLNVYFRVQNLFNRKNVLNVYRYTGSAEDDGYLTSGTFLSSSNANDQSFIDLYNAKLLGPGNYSLPRRATIGATLTF